jgi:nucleoid-associated protein EbfC
MNVAKLLQQAQQAQAQVQRTLSALEVEGSAGGGLVRVRLNGLKEMRGVSIDGAALAGEGVTLLEDLVMAAWEEANRQIEARSREILAGLGLPPGMPGLT